MEARLSSVAAAAGKLSLPPLTTAIQEEMFNPRSMPKLVLSQQAQIDILVVRT